MEHLDWHIYAFSTDEAEAGIQVDRFSLVHGSWAPLPPLQKMLDRHRASCCCAVALGTELFVLSQSNCPSDDDKYHWFASYNVWRERWDMLEPPILHDVFNCFHETMEGSRSCQVAVHRGSIVISGRYVEPLRMDDDIVGSRGKGPETVARWAQSTSESPKWALMEALPVKRVSRLVSCDRQLYTLSTAESSDRPKQHAETMSAIECWDEEKQIWRKLEPMAGDDLLHTVRNGALHAVGKYIVAILIDEAADVEADPPGSVWMFDTRCCTWSQCEAPPTHRRLCRTVAFRGAVHVLGGFQTLSSSWHGEEECTLDEFIAPPSSPSALQAFRSGRRRQCALERVVSDLTERQWLQGPDVPSHCYFNTQQPFLSTPDESLLFAIGGEVSDGGGPYQALSCFVPNAFGGAWVPLPEVPHDLMDGLAAVCLHPVYARVLSG